MTRTLLFGAAAAVGGLVLVGLPAVAVGEAPPRPPKLDHVVVVEGNKDFEQIVTYPEAPYLNTLRKEGACFTQMNGEERHGQGNYFWLYSGDNNGVGFFDGVPNEKIKGVPNLGRALLDKGLTFGGYSESLPEIGSEVVAFPPHKKGGPLTLSARKHVPWVSFANLLIDPADGRSYHPRFDDFPQDFTRLPTVAFVIPNLSNDMHDPFDKPEVSILRGDAWLKTHLDAHYQWAKTHNSLLIVTFDENDDEKNLAGRTDPGVKPAGPTDRKGKDRQNRVFMVFAGAHVKPGEYGEGDGITYVNILRTLEAMYGLKKSGRQQPNAAKAGITDDFVISDVFEPEK
jgi:phosphatidylinositol-3-phosphatase